MQIIRHGGIDSTVGLYEKFEGANLSTVFFDSSQNHATLTIEGNPIISTGDSVFGGTSLYVTNGAVVCPYNTNIDFGTGDFGVAFWFKPNTACLIQCVVDARATTPAGDWLNFCCFPNNDCDMIFYRNSQNAFVYDNIITESRWYYCVCSRSNGTSSIWVDGVLGDSGTDTHDYTHINPHSFRTGRNAQPAYAFTGYIDEVYVVKGRPIDGSIMQTRRRG